MDSYCLAPEWARQDAVILVWPHSKSDWGKLDAGGQLAAIEITYIEMSRYIVRHQKLILIAQDQIHIQQIQSILTYYGISQENILYVDIPTDDTWVRDYGPIVVQSGNTLTSLNFTFDAWGGKYPHKNDNLFNQHLKQKISTNSPFIPIDAVIEGGNIEVNSKGILLCSSSCLERNSPSKKIQSAIFEENFANWLGCNQVLWIHDIVLDGDDTDGHIDTIARFCTDDVIVYSAPGKHTDINSESLKSLSKQLQKIKSKEPSISELIPLPLPKPIFSKNHSLPANYANFLITNEYVLVPVFNDKQDKYTLKIIDELFPSREIIDIESNALIHQFGGIHCATMQIPQGFLI